MDLKLIICFEQIIRFEILIIARRIKALDLKLSQCFLKKSLHLALNKRFDGCLLQLPCSGVFHVWYHTRKNRCLCIWCTSSWTYYWPSTHWQLQTKPCYLGNNNSKSIGRMTSLSIKDLNALCYMKNGTSHDVMWFDFLFNRQNLYWNLQKWRTLWIQGWMGSMISKKCNASSWQQIFAYNHLLFVDLKWAR